MAPTDNLSFNGPTKCSTCTIKLAHGIHCVFSQNISFLDGMMKTPLFNLGLEVIK